MKKELLWLGVLCAQVCASDLDRDPVSAYGGCAQHVHYSAEEARARMDEGKTFQEKRYQEYLGITALMDAAYRGDVECAKALLDQEAGRQDKEGHTALMFAADLNHLDIVKMLIEREKCMQDECSRTALIYAAEQGHSEIVNVLLEYERGMCDVLGRTALMHAVINNRISVLDELMAQEKCLQDVDGKTALMLAIELGRVDFISALKAHESNVRDRNGLHAIAYTVRYLDNHYRWVSSLSNTYYHFEQNRENKEKALKIFRMLLEESDVSDIAEAYSSAEYDSTKEELYNTYVDVLYDQHKGTIDLSQIYTIAKAILSGNIGNKDIQNNDGETAP